MIGHGWLFTLGPVALLWMVHWGGVELETRFGAPPAQEMVSLLNTTATGDGEPPEHHNHRRRISKIKNKRKSYQRVVMRWLLAKIGSYDVVGKISVNDRV